MANSSAKAAEPLSLRITFDRVGLAFPGHAPLFEDFTLCMDPGVTAILGASGVGKSSLLRLISGRLAPTAGHVAAAAIRRIAWMGQSGGLLPWADVATNLTLGAQLRGEPPDDARAASLLARLGLADHRRKRPAELSGGMQQRVALGRCLMEDAEIVLLDEPFAHLDARTKAQLISLCARELTGRIVVMVTHDPLDAMTIADRLIVLTGSPARLSLDERIAGSAPRDPRDAKFDSMFHRIMSALELT